MIIADTQTTVITHGQMETVEFEIKTDDAKMFHILSNLYSNPLGAVVREISTNCLDGHKVVNNMDTPFHIIFPGTLDMGEFITFRDFGPGMSYESILNVYTKFGQSTKVNSNDQTGCLGLGSKSPLAITSSFTVTSICDGLKSVYSVTKDGYGKPNLAIFAKNLQTDEPSGMSITVPLTDQYKNKVLSTIKDELKYFERRPLLLRNGIELEEREFKWDEPVSGWHQLLPNVYIKRTKDINQNEIIKNNVVIQGEIGYSFNIDTLLKTFSTDINTPYHEVSRNMKLHPWTRALVEKFFSHFKVQIFAEMGSVSFQPNREDLIYDISTSLSIMRNIIKIITRVEQSYRTFFKMFKNKYTLNSSYNYGGVPHFILNKLEDTLDRYVVGTFNMDIMGTFQPAACGFTLSDGSLLAGPYEKYKTSGSRHVSLDTHPDWMKNIIDVYTIGLSYDYNEKINIPTFKKLVTRSKARWEKEYTYSISAFPNCVSDDYDKFGVVFIPEDEKFHKKHVQQFQRFMGDKYYKVVVIRLKHVHQYIIDDIMNHLGLGIGDELSWAEIQEISNKWEADNATLVTAEKVAKVRVKQTVKFFQYDYKKNVPTMTNMGEIEINKDNRDEVLGVYIPTSNKKIQWSEDFLKDYGPLKARILEENSILKFFRFFKNINFIFQIPEAGNGVKFYIGNPKFFEKTKLISIEQFFLNHIKQLKSLIDIRTNKDYSIELFRDKALSLMNRFDIYNLKIPEAKLLQQNHFNLTSHDVANIRNAVVEKFIPFEDWFNYENPYTELYKLYRDYREKNEEDPWKTTEALEDSNFINYSGSSVRFLQPHVAKFIEEQFGLKITVKVHDLEFDYDYENVGSNVTNTSRYYSSNTSNIDVFIQTINKIDYIKHNVPKELYTFHRAPIHGCDLPPPEPEPEVIPEKEIKTNQIMEDDVDDYEMAAE